MTWTAYQVSFRLLSPMHIGWRKLGNLQQTRPYLTGRNLWGALTARLTRESGGSDYVGIGKQVDEQLAFTYFYPYALPKEDSPWLWPDQWDDFAWPWSDWDKFAWTFLGSYASTALANGRNAEAGSLHETEFIAPRTREGRHVYLLGYIFKKDPCNLDWQGALGKFQLGGERGYGWGRVHLQGGCEQVNNGRCFGYDLVCGGDRPQITVPKEKKLLAHTQAVGYEDVIGTIEPLVGRITNDTGFGRTISHAEICWVPGGTVKEERAFQIQPKGIWEH